MIKIRTKMAKVEIDPLLIILWVILFLLGILGKFLLFYTAIFLHEMGHAVTAISLGKKVNTLKILPVGLTITLDEDRSGIEPLEKVKRIAIYFSGPALNLILTLIGMIINTYYLYGSDNMRFFILINGCLGIFNLFPVLPLDGGKITRELFMLRVGFMAACRSMKVISICFLIVIFVLGGIQFIGNCYNFSLILMGIYISLSMKTEGAEAAFMNIKSILFKRSRFLKRGIYPARELVAVKTVPLGEVLKWMDFDRFHMIYMLDEDLRFLQMITEQQIVDGLMKYNADMTLEELIRAGEGPSV